MKRHVVSALCILMLAAVTACGGASAVNSSPNGGESSSIRTADLQIPENGGRKPVGTKEPEQTSEQTLKQTSKQISEQTLKQTSKQTPEQASEQATAPELAYSGLVERFRTLVSDPFGQDSDEPGEMGVLETARGMGNGAVYGMGCLIEDLSGDGIPELAVGVLNGPVNALYTLADGSPQLVLEGWYRNAWIYQGDGRFYNYGSDGVAVSFIRDFILSRDGRKPECENFYFTWYNDLTEELDVYCNETGSLNPDESEAADMTAEAFWSLKPPESALSLTPFSGGGSGDTAGIPVSVEYLPEGMFPDYHVTLYDGDGAAFLLFTTDSPVTELTVLALELKDFTETGAAIFSAAPVVPEEGLDSLPEVMTADTPVAVQLGFMGTIPNYGISYVDGGGYLRRFALVQSGYDGSVLLEEADPQESEFILRAGCRYCRRFVNGKTRCNPSRFGLRP